MEERLSRGQSLFEVVVALAVTALIIVAIVALAANSIRNSTFARNKTLAARHAEAATEWLRGQRDGNTDVFFANTAVSAKWCFPDLSGWPSGPSGTCTQKISGTPFIRTIEFTRGTVGTGKTLVTADVVVTWDDAQGSHVARSTTDFTDWSQR